MSASSSIEWTEATWNPVSGCTEVSAGCDRCYAKTFAERFRGTPGHYFERGFDVQLRPNMLELPLTWRKPKRIFVNSMSDLFHDQVPADYIAQVWAVMAIAQQHTFQVLTKRHARMRSLLTSGTFQTAVAEHILSMTDADELKDAGDPFPLPNVWLGVSTESQQWADIRIPALLDTPAAVRFISAEPLLGPIDIARYLTGDCPHCGDEITDPPCGLTHANMSCDPTAAGLDWVIVGGESGRGARPMHPDWARSLRNQCAAAGVNFLFKQWGEWAPIEPDAITSKPSVFFGLDGKGTYYADRYRGGVATLARVGKKAAGRELDGRTWDQFPEVSNA